MSDIFRDFDKKNEIPKVKIPKFATGGICNDAIFPKLDAFSQIDEIVKDIAKKKDNAIAMEFTKCIGELLKNNGVVPKLTEYTRNFETENTFETRFGVSIDELDFSEHDKVFEDKIAELKKQIDRLNEEKSFLRTRCMPYVEKDFDNRLYGKLAIVSCNEEFVDIQKYADGDDLYSREVRNLISEGGIKRLIGQYRNLSLRLDKMSAENKALKQRIAELESKKAEEPTKINLNNHIKVKLTPLGADIYYHQYDEIKGDYPKIEKYLTSKLPRVDDEGYTEFQLHHFIELYGGYIGVGKKNVIEPLDIIVAE